MKNDTWCSVASVTYKGFATEYTLKRNGEYKRKHVPLILYCRHYDLLEIVDCKREKVLLYWPFQKEALDILDRYKLMEVSQLRFRFLKAEI
jgi:hypothetical protein